jgi:hypothetical protein
LIERNIKAKCIKIIRNVFVILRLFTSEFRITHFKNLFWFISDYYAMLNLLNEHFNNFELAPCLNDKTSFTPIEPVYFYQDTWAASKLFKLKPKHHYDVASSAKTIGILSQFVPITMIDIRPLPVTLSNLTFIKGSITDLPIDDNSVESISSLCVVEHIGLGRYGDCIDPFGSEKAIAELKRVVTVGGVVLLSVPVDRANTVYFNAHRAFTREYVLSLFAGFKLLEEKYQYGYDIVDTYSEDSGFGTGLFMFKKEIRNVL